MKTALYIIGILALGWSVFIILNTTLLTWFGQDLAMMAVEDFYSLAIAQALLIPIFLYLGWVARKRIYLDDAYKVLEAHRDQAFKESRLQLDPYDGTSLEQREPILVEGQWVYPIGYTGPVPVPSSERYEEWNQQGAKQS